MNRACQLYHCYQWTEFISEYMIIDILSYTSHTFSFSYVPNCTLHYKLFTNCLLVFVLCVWTSISKIVVFFLFSAVSLIVVVSTLKFYLKTYLSTESRAMINNNTINILFLSNRTVVGTRIRRDVPMQIHFLKQ